MIIGKSIQDLTNQLYLTLEKYNTNKEVMEKVQSNLFNRNIFEARQILGTGVALESLEDEIIYLLTQFLFEASNEEKINPTTYFTPNEIDDMKTFKKKKRDIVKYPIIIENVNMMNDNQWTMTVPAQVITGWYNSQLITYNFETQREAELIEKDNGTFIRKPNVNWDSVNDIAKLMSEGLFYSNYITINVLQNGEDEVIYDEEKRVLLIKSGQLDILDGFHRSLGMLKASRAVKNLNFITGLMITNLNVSSANAFIRQEDKRNKIDERHIKAKDDSNLANEVVKAINTDTKSDMRGKIVTDEILIKKNVAYTLTDILSDSIESLYSDELKNRKDKFNLERYLIDFFNWVYAIKQDDFDNLTESRKNNLTTDKNMFIFYTCLSKFLHGNDNWRNELESILNKVDFSKTNAEWKMIKVSDINLRNLNKIIKNIEKTA